MVLAQLDHRPLSLASLTVARALFFSVLLHLLLFLTIEVGHQAGFWKETLLFPKKQAQIDARTARLLAEKKKQEQAVQEIPLVFVDVDPSQATREAPADAKYYSALNSRAANPDTRQNLPTPKIEGKQQRVPQTLDKAKPVPQPLQPAPAPPPEPQVAEEKPEPEPIKAQVQPPKPAAPPETPTHPGDLAYAKPSEKPAPKLETRPTEQTEPTTPARPRPRKLAEVRPPPKSGMAGQKMKQPGGARRFSLEPSFDVRATPFGTYDAKIIAAIQKRWYDLLDAREFSGNYSGKVVLEFRLNSDGRVTDMKVGETDVTELLALLCQRAVQDPAPFDPWPSDLRRLVGKEYREVRFTFYYN